MRGRKKARSAQEHSAQLAGRRQRAIVQACACRGACMSNAGPGNLLSSWGKFPCHRNGEREMSELQWLPKDAFISGTQRCLGLLSVLTGKQLY